MILTGLPVIARKSEAEIQAEIRLAVGKLPHVRLWRNNVGEAWQGQVVERTAASLTLLMPRRVQYGLCEGSSDLIGATQVVVTPDMVGHTLAVFTAPEVKRPGKNPEPAQRNFLRFVQEFGGISGVVRSPDDMLRLVRA